MALPCPPDPLDFSRIGTSAGIFAAASELHPLAPGFGKQWVVFLGFAGLSVVKAGGEFIFAYEVGHVGPVYETSGADRIPLFYASTATNINFPLVGGGFTPWTTTANFTNNIRRLFVPYPNRVLFSWIGMTVGASYDEKLLILESPLGTPIQHLL